IRLRALDQQHSESTLPFSRRSRNHVGSIYLGTLVVHAELTMALFALSACRPPRYRVLVNRNEVDYHSKASGTVRAVCEPDVDERAGLDRCQSLIDDRGECWLTVRTHLEATREPVCTARFLLTVSHRTPKASARD
ncbi:MAG TPA: DUF4442 domain-containing protein, partial [Myxococcota bacterium]